MKDKKTVDKGSYGSLIDIRDHTQYRALKRAYYKAVEENKEQFVFEGKELLTTYCKYLLEYIEDIRKKLSFPVYNIKQKK